MALLTSNVLEYGFGYDTFTTIVRFACIAILAVLGLWCNQSHSRNDYKPLLHKDEDTEKEKAKSYGGFSEIEVSFPTLSPLSAISFLDCG